MLLHLPLRYVDETKIQDIGSARPGEWLQADVIVVSSNVQFRPKKTLVCQVEDSSGALTLRFFKAYPTQIATLKAGVRLRIFGEVRDGFLGLEMIHPQWRVLHKPEPLPKNLTPVYPTTAGLSQQNLRKLIKGALNQADLSDTLPPEMLAALALPDFKTSLGYVHEPPADADLATLSQHPAMQRLKLDELLAQQLSLRLYRQKNRNERAYPLKPRANLTKALLAALPFQLTSGQTHAYQEINRDLLRPFPMQRLLQGDVGSGKTIVAVLAALTVIENGAQVALMAPTEILAEQHYRKLSAWLAPLKIELAWLTARLNKKEKMAALRQLADGSCRLAVGTHALFQEHVEFSKLALVIIDEQHRFGVEQRIALRNKAELSAHQLMMSATPIPRTLAMSYYSDMDISTIAELPPGRSPVTTKLFAESKRSEVARRIKSACLEGKQAYWVCPLIDESEVLQLKAAQQTFVDLKKLLPELNIGLIHGRMTAADKTAIMAEFQQGHIQLLVATSVIEVGVDVANASIMIIEHAERLGLAQLHQLRGRVGRGKTQSTCILLYQSPLSENARERLKIIYELQDGFEIARLDLAMRGPGELLGARQAGVPLLRIADICTDQALLVKAQALAADLLKAHPDLADRHLARWLPAAAAYLGS